MELVFCGLLAALLIFLLTVATGIPGQTVDGDIVRASGFPTAIIIVALLLLVVLMVGYVRNCKKEGKPLFSSMGISKNVIANVGVVTGYIVLMNVLGFALSTLMFTFCNARVMGYKKYRALILFSVILSTALVLVFGKLFFIPLPRGMGFLRELSYYIY